MTNHKSKPAASRHLEILRDKGWTYRTGAAVLGVAHTHLFHVLRGDRESRRLLSAIERMPRRAPDQPAKKASLHPFSNPPAAKSKR